MVFINETGTLGAIILNLSSDVTGSLFLALLLIAILYFGVILAMRIPLELGLVFIMPLLIVLMAFRTEFMVLGGVVIIILGFFFAYWFLGR